MRKKYYYINYLISSLFNSRLFSPLFNEDIPSNIDCLSPLTKEISYEIDCNGYALTNLYEFLNLHEIYKIESYLNNLKAQKRKIHHKNFLENYIGGDLTSKRYIKLDFQNPLMKISLNPVILSIAKKYFKQKVKLIDINLSRTIPLKNNERSFSQKWHRDPGIKGALKVFIYFSNVCKNSGPFEYIPFTHHKNIDSSSYGPKSTKKFGGSYYPEQKVIDIFLKNSNNKPKSFLGEKGTVIFADTTGYHRGGFSEDKSRLMLTLVYYPALEPINSRIKIDYTEKYNLSKFQKSFI